MFILRPEKLKTGDIILSKNSDKVSEEIRKATNSNYSHAMLYAGLNTTIESNGPGVYTKNINQRIFDNENDVKVLRLKDPIGDRVNSIILYARSKIGTQYSDREALKVIRDKKETADQPNRQFCTRLVATAYDSVGCKIVSTPEYCSPEDIEKSELLLTINDVLKEASNEEMEFANAPSVNDLEIESENRFLREVREITKKDLQTFQQVVNLMKEPNLFEEDIANALEESGYLKLWEDGRCEEFAILHFLPADFQSALPSLSIAYFEETQIV